MSWQLGHFYQGGFLLRPTDEELEIARILDIDTTNMNGPQVREAIRRAQAARRPKARWRPGMTDGQRRFNELCLVAESLGLIPLEGIQLANLRIMVEARLQELFSEKGFEQEAIIQYSLDAPLHMYKRAKIVNLSILWRQDMPYIALCMEGSRTKFYFAHDAALHAVVIGW